MRDECNSSTVFLEFMSGFNAAVLLLQRAARNGFFVEHVCLGASIIDATLRVALVLKHQLLTSSSDIPKHLIRQSESDRPLTERQVYREAHVAGIIDDSLYSELQSLFTERNRVVHRYIISGITTADVFEIACRFKVLITRVSDAARLLEDEQVLRGVGMTTGGSELSRKELLRTVKDLARTKHGAYWMSRRLEESP